MLPTEKRNPLWVAQLERILFHALPVPVNVREKSCDTRCICSVWCRPFTAVLQLTCPGGGLATAKSRRMAPMSSCGAMISIALAERDQMVGTL
jgi:hypothetical protein